MTDPPRRTDPTPRTDPTGRATRPLRLAHRGDQRAAAENSLDAFAAALAIPGCDGLEFDVHLSRDGIPVVTHDETLDRVQGRPGRVVDVDAADLERLGIPTLAAVLQLASPPAFLDVELKVDGGDAVADTLRAARGNALVRAVVSSFELDALESIRRLEPAWPVWLNAEDLTDETVRLARRLGCRGISVLADAIDAASAARVADAGLDLAAWTVTTMAEWDRLAALGMIGICVEDEALDGTPAG